MHPNLAAEKHNEVTNLRNIVNFCTEPNNDIYTSVPEQYVTSMLDITLELSVKNFFVYFLG